MLFLKFLNIFVFMFFSALGLKMIPESIKVTHTNDKYVKDLVVNIRRFMRNDDYYINIYGESLHTWANNISVHIIVNQFLHNEYRRSFIEFHYRFCDMINKEPMFGGMLRQAGMVCPSPKGKFRLMKMTIQSENFPNVWPFEKGGADFNVNLTDTGELVLMGYIHMLFKDNNKKG